MEVKLKQVIWNQYFDELKERYIIYAPVCKKGKGKFAETDVIGYDQVQSPKEIVWDQKSYFSPKEMIFPIRETLFRYEEGRASVPEINHKPILVILRPCDINGIEKLDCIFLKNGNEKDYYYERRRKLVKFMMIECTEGFDTCFCVSMKSNITEHYDAAISFKGDEIFINIKDSELVTDCLKNAPSIQYKPNFIKENKVKVTIPDVNKVTNECFQNPLWTEYAGRCIACGRCNTSCVTCSCFSMQDVMLSDDSAVGERRRVWAGCHVDGFSDMAGGHRFRDNKGERMRFKTMHKINDFYRRFSSHMCVGCGRCDDVCPEYISFSKCINRLNRIIEEVDHGE